MFEVVSCYFPITFSQPKDDPIGITQHDLLEALTICLTSTPIFATLVLDLVFEKLGSGMDTAKLQGYDLLGYSATVFGMKGYGTALSQIFTAVRTELFQSHDDAIKTAALNCLTAVTRMVSKSPAMAVATGEANPLAAFLTPLVNESTRHLADFDVGLIRLHGRLLDATARGSEVACRHLCSTYLPELLSKATAKASVDHRSAYSSVANALLSAALSVNAVGAGSLMSEHKDVVFAMFRDLVGASDKGLRAAGLLGGANLVATELLLPSEVEELSADAVKALLEDKEPEVRAQAAVALRAVARHSPESTKTLVLPPLVAKLGGGAGGGESGVGAGGGAAGAAAVVVTPEEAREVVQVLGGAASNLEMALVVLAEFLPLLAGAAQDTARAHVASAIAEATRNLLTMMASDYPEENLFELAVKPCLVAAFAPMRSKGADAELWGTPILQLLAAGFQACCRAMPVALQSAALTAVVCVFRDGDVGAVGVEGVAATFPFLKENHKPAARAIVMLPALLGSFKRNVTAELDGITALVTTLVEAASSGADGVQCRAAAIAAAALVNKCSVDALSGYLDELSAKLGGQLQATAADPGDRAKHISTWAWLCKALVMRAHPSAAAFTATLVEFLSDAGVGMAAAASFEVVVSDCAEALNTKSHANLRIMYRQRYFLENVPGLIEGLHNAEADLKKHFLIALSHLLGAVTHQVLLSELSRVFPVLVQSLSQSETSLVAPTVKIIQSLIADVPDFITDHVDALVPLLLELCGHEKLAVRASVLQCLSSIAVLPEHKVFPLASKVIKALRPALDDHKRVVRKEAVNCCSKWYVIGGSQSM